MARNYAVAQIGARMHYAVPRILNSAGRLDRLLTDFAAVGHGFGLLRKWPTSLQPHSIRRMLARIPQGLPANLITAFKRFGLRYVIRLRLSQTEDDRIKAHLWAGRQFSQCVVAAGFGRAEGIYAFNTASLEILVAARRLRLRTVLEQTIAPKRIERRLLLEENRAFPGWEAGLASDHAAALLIQREEAEWEAADVIVCGSEFVRDGISECGGPAHKCVIVPYGVTTPTSPRPHTARAPDSPLRVLMVGAICLRKGAGYVSEAAERLKARAEIRLVGPILVSRRAAAAMRSHVELSGAVPRTEVRKHYEWADILVLPSICEGSATVTYEALSNGLPVICTPNTGSVVCDGYDGFIIPIRSTDALVRHIERLRSDHRLLRKLSINAATRANEFTLGKYAERLLQVLD